MELRARKAGTATITVVATDFEGESLTKTFTVTVISWVNAAPASTSVNLPAALTLTGANRLKSTELAAKTVKVDLGLHFTDTNVSSISQNDTLSFSTASSDKDVATASLTSTNNAAIPYEYNVSVMPVGPGTTVITLIATDSFGEVNTGTPKTFSVQVNNKPNTYGPNADSTGDARMTLVGYQGFMNMDVRDDNNTTGNTIDLDNYFSDADTADTTLTCDFVTSESSKAAADKIALVTVDTSDNSLGVDPQHIGTMTATVWCSDSFEESDRVTVTIEVDRGASIHS